MRIVWEERDDRCSGRYGWFGRPTAWQSCTLGLWERSGRPPVTPPGDLEHVPMVWRPLRIQEAPSARPFSIDSMDYIWYDYGQTTASGRPAGPAMGTPRRHHAARSVAMCKLRASSHTTEGAPWTARQAQSERASESEGAATGPLQRAACCVLRSGGVCSGVSPGRLG